GGRRRIAAADGDEATAEPPRPATAAGPPARRPARPAQRTSVSSITGGKWQSAYSAIWKARPLAISLDGLMSKKVLSTMMG
ncbi:MAG: hypothetical protein ACPGSK_03500, partial [Alphaproteobacteria bacterium]